MSYPKIIKEAALEKMFHTDISLRHISDELGIPRATLHGWKRQYQMMKGDSETINTPTESWTPEEKFAVALLMRIGVTVPREGIAPAMQGMISETRLGKTMAGRLVALLFDHRHLTLAVCLNIPGNSALGGGGGLALLCGLSRQFGWRSFLLTVAIATSPVPILVLADLLNIEPLMEHHGFVHDLLTRIEKPFIHD